MYKIILAALLLFADSSIPVQDKIPLYEHKPIRQSQVQQPLLKDLESHSTESHIGKWDSKITWAHEITHQINADLRNKYHQPCYYLTASEFAALKPEKKKLADVARIVHPILRDHLYDLYLVKQQTGLGGGWNDEPYYLLDEWSAYCNGSLLRNELMMKEEESEVLFMMEFSIFASYLCIIERQADLIEFVKFNTHRSFNIYYRSPGNMAEVNKYLAFIRTDHRLEELRVNMKNVLGVEFCSRVWGF